MIKHVIIEKLLLKIPKLSNRILNYIIRNRFGRLIKNLEKKSIEIKCVYDIGANRGEWSSFYKSTSLNKSNFYLFEANEAHKEILEKKKFNVYFGVLSNEEKKLQFYNNNNSTGDSYYKENTENHKNLTPQEVNTVTLNKLVERNSLPLPDLIKIDTQGSEIDILKGANKILENCKLIYLECPIIAKFNQNNLNILDYLKFVESIGFVPHDINQMIYYHGYFTHLDLVFIKKNLLQKLNLNPNLLQNFY